MLNRKTRRYSQNSVNVLLDFSRKVCNNGSLKLGTIGVGAPVNHINPSKDKKSKTKHGRNLIVVQKSFSISSLVSKSSAVASKGPLAVATSDQSTSSATGSSINK